MAYWIFIYASPVIFRVKTEKINYLSITEIILLPKKPLNTGLITPAYVPRLFSLITTTMEIWIVTSLTIHPGRLVIMIRLKISAIYPIRSEEISYTGTMAAI